MPTVHIQREYKLCCRQCKLQWYVDSSIKAEHEAKSHVNENSYYIEHEVEITDVMVVKN